MLGADTRAMSDAALSAFRARRIGFVFQAFQLLPHLTALENLLLPALFAGVDVGEQDGRALLDRVGLGARAESRPGQLSGGEQQRVAVARAALLRPALLLCDEPTGSLDADAADGVMRLLESLHAERDVTLLVVTHEDAVAARASRCVTLEAGRVVEDRP